MKAKRKTYKCWVCSRKWDSYLAMQLCVDLCCKLFESEKKEKPVKP